jgi:hypothetical protein
MYTQIHFAFDKMYYNDGSINIVTCKQIFCSIIAALRMILRSINGAVGFGRVQLGRVSLGRM